MNSQPRLLGVVLTKTSRHVFNTVRIVQHTVNNSDIMEPPNLPESTSRETTPTPTAKALGKRPAASSPEPKEKDVEVDSLDMLESTSQENTPTPTEKALGKRPAAMTTTPEPQMSIEVDGDDTEERGRKRPISFVATPERESRKGMSIPNETSSSSLSPDQPLAPKRHLLQKVALI